jgi:hypothetical protein
MSNYNVYARLTINDEEVDISAFSYTEDQGSIGRRVSCNITDLSYVVPDDAVVTFEIGIQISGGTEWVVLLEDGIANSDTAVTKWLEDDYNFIAISKLSETWDTHPERPIVLYDPAAVDPIEELGFTPGELVDRDFNPIEPLLIPKANFSLHDLMNYVYVEVMGFTQVATNLPNYRLNSVNIGLTQSFQSAVASEIGIFEPKYSENMNNIWIIDPQGTLPPEMPIRATNLRHYVEFQRTRQLGKKINCVILEYSENTLVGSAEPTQKTKQSTTEAGIFGSQGWQRNSTTEIYYEYPDGRIVPLKTTIALSAIVDGLTRTVSLEEKTDTYKYDNQLKTGYVKGLSLYCRLPGTSARMRPVQTETNKITWVALASAGEFLKVSESTEIRGLVLEYPQDGGSGVFQSIYDANKRGEIPEEADDVEILTDRAITTKIETFKDVGRDQIEVNSQRINYIQSDAPPDLNNSVNHTGTIRVRATGPQAVRRRVVLLGPNPTPRKAPYILNAGNIPKDIAFDLADRILAREGIDPAVGNINFVGLDLACTRGTLRRVRDRKDEEHLTFITSVTITGNNLGQVSFSFNMTAQGVERRE